MEFEKWMRKNLKKIHRELFQLNTLKEMWNTPKFNGHVTLKIRRCERYYCETRVKNFFYKKAIPAAHSFIIGYSVDKENKKRKNFLGYTYVEAKQRINHIKSFLY